MRHRSGDPAQKTERTKKMIRIPLTPPLLAWIGERKGLFFPRAAGVSAATLSTQFPRLMARCGVAADVMLPGNIPARRSFHSLRHSFTTWLAEADIHADVRRKLTGIRRRRFTPATRTMTRRWRGRSVRCRICRRSGRNPLDADALVR